jgi:hypothetical protein
MILRPGTESGNMSYRCDRCGEAIDEHQFYSFGRLCPACVRATLGDEGVEAKQGAAPASLASSAPSASSPSSTLDQKAKTWFLEDRNRIWYVTILSGYVTLVLLWILAPSFAGFGQVGLIVLTILFVCWSQKARYQPHMVKKER